MKRLLGSNVNVILKPDGEVVSGVLFDTEEEYIYIQNDVGLLITIPKDNVKYYVSNSFQKSSVDTDDKSQEVAVPPQPTAQSSLSVYVNQTFIIEIPVPPTFDLLTFHDDIMKVVLGNPDVKAVLAGRIQKSLEYVPGKVYFTVDDSDSEPLVEPTPQPTTSPDGSFSMSAAGNSAAGSFLNPSQMVTRLNKATQKKPEEVKNNE